MFWKHACDSVKEAKDNFNFGALLKMGEEIKELKKECEDVKDRISNLHRDRSKDYQQINSVLEAVNSLLKRESLFFKDSSESPEITRCKCIKIEDLSTWHKQKSYLGIDANGSKCRNNSDSGSRVLLVLEDDQYYLGWYKTGVGFYYLNKDKEPTLFSEPVKMWSYLP